MTGTINSVIRVAYARPPMITIPIPFPSWEDSESPIHRLLSASIVVRAVIRMGRILVLPATISASCLSSPPFLSWLV